MTSSLLWLVVYVRRTREIELTKIALWCLPLIVGLIIGFTIDYNGLLFGAIHIQLQVSAADDGNTSAVLRRLGLPVDHLGNVTSLYVVPNIVHFIWFADSSSKQLTFINYISILSAHRIQKPDSIWFHCNHLPSGDWWDRLWREVPLKIVHHSPPEYIHGQPIDCIYHRGDVAKMDILVKYGGIYLDYDVIVVNSLDSLRHYDATLGKEKPPKFIAGIMISRKGSTFMRLLHESYRNNYRPNDWDYNCARVAYKIYQQWPDLLHVEPYKLTTPDWLERDKLWKEVINWKDLYVVHLMGHDTEDGSSPESIKMVNSTFGEVMRYIYYGSHTVITS